MKNNRNMKRRGFTLVELLIVIVVIGVLSAMMMLSSTEAVSSARASNIVSNLRNLKTAALAFYIDHVDSYDLSTIDAAAKLDADGIKAKILKYMGNDSNNITDDYGFIGEGPDTWFVYYNIKNDANVKSKLAGRAASVGLLGATASSGTGDTTKPTFTKNGATYKDTDGFVAMFIR